MEATYALVPLPSLAERELSPQVLHAHHARAGAAEPAPAPGGLGPPDIECHCLGIYMLILLPLLGDLHANLAAIAVIAVILRNS